MRSPLLGDKSNEFKCSFANSNALGGYYRYATALASEMMLSRARLLLLLPDISKILAYHPDVAFRVSPRSNKYIRLHPL
jgi:hypothetical protein